MAQNQIVLDVAAFLDSPQAQALPAPAREDVRRVAEVFLLACYEDLGKKPRLLDGQDVQALLGHLIPGRLAPRDPLAEHLPAVLGAYLDHLEATQVVGQAFEIRRGLEEAIEGFLETVRTGRNADRQTAVPRKPFVHGAPKVGRNDPCWCGSGRKFKKCHGAGA